LLHDHRTEQNRRKQTRQGSRIIDEYFGENYYYDEGIVKMKENKKDKNENN
jgi:hypothetical protein